VPRAYWSPFGGPRHPPGGPGGSRPTGPHAPSSSWGRWLRAWARRLDEQARSGENGRPFHPPTRSGSGDRVGLRRPCYICTASGAVFGRRPWGSSAGDGEGATAEPGFPVLTVSAGFGKYEAILRLFRQEETLASAGRDCVAGGD